MTTTVKQGAGRTAAAAKTAKAAQNTPLPPKAPKTESAAPQLGKMTLADLRAYAVEIGMSTGTKIRTKGPLLEAIMKYERAGAKVDAILQPSESDVAIEEAFPLPAPEVDLTTATPTKSEAKAAAFGLEAVRLGWAIKSLSTDGDKTTAAANRGSDAQIETITIEWISGVFTGEGYYSHAARTPIKLRNVSAAKKQMAIPAAQAAEAASKVTAHKAVRGPARKAGSVKHKLPFDPETATDVEILAAIKRNAKISWTNAVSGDVESTRIGGTPTVKDGTSGRSLNFTDAAGFRSVRISSILSIR